MWSSVLQCLLLGRAVRVTNSVILLQLHGFVYHCVKDMVLATSEGSDNSSLSHSTVHKSRGSPRDLCAALHCLYPCGASWPTCEDDVQIHEALHGSHEHMCQGMEDGNHHIHFNVRFKMTIPPSIFLQPLELSEGGSTWEEENEPGDKWMFNGDFYFKTILKKLKKNLWSNMVFF